MIQINFIPAHHFPFVYLKWISFSLISLKITWTSNKNRTKQCLAWNITRARALGFFLFVSAVASLQEGAYNRAWQRGAWKTQHIQSCWGPGGWCTWGQRSAPSAGHTCDACKFCPTRCAAPAPCHERDKWGLTCFKHTNKINHCNQEVIYLSNKTLSKWLNEKSKRRGLALFSTNSLILPDKEGQTRSLHGQLNFFFLKHVESSAETERIITNLQNAKELSSGICFGGHWQNTQMHDCLADNLLIAYHACRHSLGAFL